jgi:endoglucanase
MKQIVVLCILLSNFAAALAASPTAEIRVDQAGYLPGMPKLAMVVAKVPAKDFSVRKASDGTVVFLGRLTGPVEDADSGDRVQAADFTKLTRSGTYYVEVPGVGRSWDFSIAPDVYSRVYYLAMRSYYGQRCGTAVDLGPEFPGFVYSACHLEGAYHASSGRSGPKETTGGWHDAGDYGRYIVNSGITTGTLLWTWELFGTRIGRISLNIPESGNSMPDILDEIRWNLDWMLSMQADDGGVWQKQTSLGFCGFIMPEKDKLVSYVIGTGKEPFKSTCATADFASVMAIAARVYRPLDAAYSQKCLKAAKRAWTWLEKHPNVTFQNPPGVSTGAYGDPNCGDELLWASAELYRTTGEDIYHRYFLAHYAAFRETVQTVPAEGWANVAPLGLWTYVLGGGKDAGAADVIRQDAIDAADRFVERTNRNGYRISMIPKDYVWGSNGVTANYGMQLLVANAINPDPRYVQTAIENLHYMLGRNTFSLSWVTQVGANPCRHPHHRPSGADGIVEPWPGLLSGGPNQNRQDAPTKNLPQLPPAKVYLDQEASYASNETCINWNAALVFILASVVPEK